MGDSRIKVFHSYARKDGAELAARLHRDLTTLGFETWLDALRLGAGASWTSEVERAIDEAGVMVALLSQGSYYSEICRAEQLRALRKGKCVIPAVAQRGCEIPLHLEAKNYLDFSDLIRYEEEFRKLVGRITEGAGVRLPEGSRFQRTYVTAPPLPPNYVERPVELSLLRSALVADGGERQLALTAVAGMGGIGKTVLAQAICHDQVIQEAFPDGVIWITIGKDANGGTSRRLREAGKALGDSMEWYDSPEGCANQFRTTIRKKAALIVLDDVWDARDLEPFRADSPRSRLLFTTRDASLAGVVGAREVTANLLNAPDARELLACWSGQRRECLPEVAGEILRECGGLPLAISMTGAMLRGKPPVYWEHVRRLLQKADLDRIRVQFPQYAHPTVFRSMQVSFEALDPGLQARYLALAVLPDDTAAPPGILQSLWETDEVEAAAYAEQLAQVCLLIRDEATGAFRLHDLQADYVRARSPMAQALPVISAAIRLSAHVTDDDPRQFSGQVTARLLPRAGDAWIGQWLEIVRRGTPRPWLRPLRGVFQGPGGPLLRTIDGRHGCIRRGSLNADERLAAAGHEDGTITIWEMGSGKLAHAVTAHRGATNAVVWLPGTRLLSAGEDGWLKVWNTESGECFNGIKGHTAGIREVAVSATGRLACTASRDGLLKLWDLEEWRVIRTLQANRGIVLSVVLTPDDRTAISCYVDGSIQVWDLHNEVPARLLCSVAAEVFSLAITPDGRMVVAASDDRTLRVLHVGTGREMRVLRGHAGYVYAVAVSACGRYCVSASADRTVRIWDLESGALIRTFEGHSGWVRSVEVTGDGQRALSASEDGTLRLWDLRPDAAKNVEPDHGGRVECASGATLGGVAVTGAADKTIRVWDLSRLEGPVSLSGHSGWVQAVAVTPDGRVAVSGSDDNTVRVWDLATGSQKLAFSGHGGWVQGVAVSSDGQWVASASYDRTVKLWDVAAGTEWRTLVGHEDWVRGVALSCDGTLVLSASSDRTLKVWDRDSGVERATLRGHDGEVTGAAFLSDGTRAISSSWDRTLKLWDLETGAGLGTLVGHANAVNCVRVSSDGAFAVSASMDRTVRVWDLASGVNYATFTCEGKALSADFVGRNMIVAGDEFGHVHVLILEMPC